MPRNRGPTKPRSYFQGTRHLSGGSWGILYRTGGRTLPTAFVAHMPSVTSQLRHLDPVTFPEASLLGEGCSDSKLRSGLHFLSSFQTELDSRGAGEPHEAEGFSPQLRLVPLGLQGEMRNQDFKGISPQRDPIYRHRPFLKKESPPSILTSCTHGEEGEAPPSRQQRQSWAEEPQSRCRSGPAGVPLWH